MGQIQKAERRLCNNVLSRFRETLTGEERDKIVSEFRAVTYDLITAGNRRFMSAPVVHPSEATGCPLRLAFALRGIPRKPPDIINPKLILTFEIGHSIHRLLQRRYGMLEKDIEFTPEVPIGPETSEIAERLCITGHCDGIFKHKKTGFRLGLEIKSISGKGFSALSSISDRYKGQATVYMACLSLPYMMFLYVDKNSSLLEPIIYDFEPERWDNIRAKIEDVTAKVLAGHPVSKIPDRMVCRNMCNFYWYCRPGV